MKLCPRGLRHLKVSLRLMNWVKTCFMKKTGYIPLLNFGSLEPKFRGNSRGCLDLRACPKKIKISQAELKKKKAFPPRSNCLPNYS